MPIPKNKRYLYSKDWKRLRKVILIRARKQCESCRAPDQTWIYRQVENPSLWKAAEPQDSVARIGQSWQFPLLKGFREPIKVILSIAHLDHDPEHNHADNLKALCQRCHLAHDRRQHAKTVAIKRMRQFETLGQLSFYSALESAAQ